MDRLSCMNARLRDGGVKKDRDHGSGSRQGSGLRLVESKQEEKTRS
ncbi:hypothetical protein LOK49_LG02G01362 [Camellia lanceoleosa]|uniref:Uncharacterized protein n=1 Tax=Camellia lanceoleosa TaxID=1840588 RepID=A0ACC0IQE0_9ERIC|nr:hypothetical protein LOK49_LG02G01362 [Camellia lanceoleosa]